ncbi:MAG: hypothetical protein VX938_04655, partial [Myxococcota bacterium]|nr:hypothetical protein [Myxococcota bacterium]
INYTTKVMNRKLSMSFGVPIRVQAIDTTLTEAFPWGNAGELRGADWDEPSDYAQLIRFFRLGGKEDRIYLDINAFTANSLGHGTLLKRYNPNLNLNTRRVSMQFDGFTDYFGGETYLNNITSPSVMGALVFLKPLSIINRDNYFLRSFSIGLSLAADIDAPLRNKIDTTDLDNDGRRDEIQVDPKTLQPNYHSTEVIGYGLDVEFKLVDKRYLDWKMYFDQSFLETGIPCDAGRGCAEETVLSNIPTDPVRASGMTWGNLFRMNLGRGTVHALRIRTELRNYTQNYLPSYFDTLYEVQRVQYFNQQSASTEDLANQTKLQEIFLRDADDDRIWGGYVEASWSVSHYFALSLGVEVNNQTPDNNLYLHLEIPHIGNMQAMLSYQHRGVETPEELFDFSKWGLGSTDILIGKLRYGVWDWFHLNAEVMTPFGIGPDSLFANTLQVNMNAEFGFPY